MSEKLFVKLFKLKLSSKTFEALFGRCVFLQVHMYPPPQGV